MALVVLEERMGLGHDMSYGIRGHVTSCCTPGLFLCLLQKIQQNPRTTNQTKTAEGNFRDMDL